MPQVNLVYRTKPLVSRLPLPAICDSFAGDSQEIASFEQLQRGSLEDGGNRMSGLGAIFENPFRNREHLCANAHLSR